MFSITFTEQTISELKDIPSVSGSVEYIMGFS